MPEISPATWSYDTAAHLLLRAGFGHDGRYKKGTGQATQVRHFANMPPQDAVDALLNIRVSKARGPGKLDGDQNAAFEKLQQWWYDRMVKGAKPLREKMVLFLHTHFATAKSKIDNSLYMAVQNALFREFAIGDFRELVKRMNIDAAMLWWLDGCINKKGAPNENYARELQELFTLGVYDFAGQRNYSQRDVTEAAKILTGWDFRENKGKIESFFTLGRHVTGAKTIYAPDALETPNQNGNNKYTEPANTADALLAESEHRRLVDAIFNHTDTEGKPTAARYIARKLWKFFAYDPVVDVNGANPRPDLTLIDDLATEFKNSNYSLASVLRALFLREEFYADATRTVKGPVEYVVGSMRMLRGKLTRDTKHNVVNHLFGEMGQDLFDPPDVFSWRGNLSWVTTQTLLKRYAFARDLAQGDKRRTSEIGCNVYSFLDTTETTRAGVVARFLTLLGPVDVDTATRNELIAWLGASDADMNLLDDGYVQTFVRGLVNLILALPHYHVH